MSTKQKKGLVRILVCVVLFLALVVLSRLVEIPGLVRLVAFLIVYAAIGWDVLYKAVRNILHGQVFDENFLMAVATVGAMVLGDYAEAVAVMLFYQVGEWFQKYAVGRSRRSITQLMDIRPDFANLKRDDGTLETVEPEAVKPGETIVVKPGERVPLDGVILEGATSLDTSALTGESAPRDAGEGEEITSGCINLTGSIAVRVSRPYGESTVAKILDLVENASGKKARAENFITRFARYYTPAVCFAALALAVLPPLVLGQAFGPWVYRALTFLVISCPCALVISVPLSFFAGIGGASRIGALVKGSNYMEQLAKVDTVVFDKTGTLTKGSFAVTQVQPAGGTADELLKLAAYAESDSSHPIAASVRAAYGKPLQAGVVRGVRELAGYGVQAEVEGHTVLAGNAKLMAQAGVVPVQPPEGGTVIHIAEDGRYRGCLLVEDEVKADAAEAIHQLKAAGVRRTVMLTGDSEAVGRKVAGVLGLDEVHAGLLPADKVAHLETLMQREGEGGKLAFVGDGINDAPVLARADVGIAMGGLGSDAAIEAADVVIMTDEPSKIPQVMRIGRKTMRIVKQNIVFALGVKGVVLLLGALGFAGMWAAVFADVGVSVIAILNAMRAFRAPKAAPPPTADAEAARTRGPMARGDAA